MTRGMRFTSLLETAYSLEDLHRTAGDFARDLQFKNFLYAVRLPKPPGPAVHFVISSYPKAWRDEYEAREYVRMDPIVLHALSSAMAICWDEVPRANQGTRDFFAAAERHDLGHGASNPVYGRRSEVGLFSIARNTPIENDLEVRLAIKHELQWFTTAFHEAAMRVALSAQQDVTFGARLSRRERECLIWANEGKTSKEIGRLMNITERTVIAHIETSGQKLGVSGRHNVISRAMASGELDVNRQALSSGRPLPKPREFGSGAHTAT
jgi:DNA-binding CsgD family transcriptional regulator